MTIVAYKEFEIKASPHQLAESGEWSLNIYITHHKGGVTLEKNFSAASTYKTREEAISHCHNFGRQVIDGHVLGCTISDM